MATRGGDDGIWGAVDPVDGTANLAAGIPLVTTCIALCWRGEVAMGVIYDPNRDEMFVARWERFLLV
jgi:myo-inositol-1(or 4)-monophosphatase